MQQWRIPRVQEPTGGCTTSVAAIGLASACTAAVNITAATIAPTANVASVAATRTIVTFKPTVAITISAALAHVLATDSPAASSPESVATTGPATPSCRGDR